MDYQLGLGISQDHLDLADSVARFARRHLPPESARTAVARTESGAGEGLPDCWSDLAAQGLLGLHVGEIHGGSGAGLLECAVVLEVMGRHLGAGVFTPTVLAAAVLAADGGKAAAEYLPGLVDGSEPGTVALTEAFTGTIDSDGALTISGRVAAVGGQAARVLLARVDTDAGHLWAAVPTDRLHVRIATSIDVTRSTALCTADTLVVPPAHVLEHIADDRVAALAAVVLGAEAVGVASWCVATATEYAGVRVQFGRPIGQFQGVKHRCAQAVIALEQARAAVWDAARALDADDDTANYAAAVARSIAPDAAVAAARDAMQVLGGIGYTWEHDAHLYYRRAVTLRGLLGRSRDCAAEVARLALAGQRRAVGYELPADAETYRRQVRSALTEIAALDEREQLRRLGDDGWVMPFLAPPSGRRADPVEQVVIAEEIARARITVPQLGLATWLLPSIAEHGTEQQRIDLVAPTLRGEIIWCQMFSEPGAGSDLAALRTEAVKVAGGWRVNGQKIWTSLGFIADWGVLLARTNPNVPKHQGITYFVVDMSSPGIDARALREASGGAMFAEIFLDDVFIPDSGVIGAVDSGWQVARGTLSHERVALGKGTPLNANVDDLLGFIATRDIDDVPLDRVGEIVADNQTLLLLNGRTVLKQLHGAEVGAIGNIAKYLNMRIGQQIADLCHAELGPAGGYEEATPQSHTWIEKTISARPSTVYGGTTEIQLNVIAERILGLPRDP
ncbi:acyl-CoA dehydrogenase [Nocardia uniformis]|uniref:Acyl-CoA dehydrogenase n=1 Tax=Nocardia uniformis TaxID=53432 RepID=A0A849C0H5_9NOCA|nr:acyl-CoA dehydrogenase [Nocardia uniformis]NNH72242.1 acyl-CoA dehydrogenase [Nocardia uniformis]